MLGFNVHRGGLMGFALVVTLLAVYTLDTRAAEPTPTWSQEARARNAEMKRRVDAWLSKGKAEAMPVHVVYLHCQDQKPFPQHRERLNRVLTEVQQWLTAQMEAAGFGTITMALERDEQGLVKLHEASLPLDVGTRNVQNKRQTHEACVTAARAVLGKSGINYDRSFVLILTTIPDDFGAAPFYGNIIQDRGYCFAVDTPWLDTEYKKNDGPAVWKGKRVGPANSALVGGIAHELGHGLGLPHSDEPAAEKSFGESLMGSGNYTWRNEKRGEGKGSYLLDTDAMLLIARPPFAGRVRDFDKQPRSAFKDLRFELTGDGQVKVTGRVETDIPAHAVKLYDDPAGGNDYDAVAHAVLADERTGAFEITFKPHSKPGEHEVRLFLYHVNGRWTRHNSRLTVEQDGKISLP